MLLPSSKVLVLFTVVAATLRVSSLIRALRARFAREKSLPAIFSRLPARMTEWDVFVSSAASMTCCVFFAVINDAGDYPILPAYRACRDARRRVETGVSPCQKGGVGGIPIRLPIFRYALLWCAAHSVTHLMCAPSFAPSTPRLPKNILRSPTSRVHAQQILRIPATGCPAA